MTHELRAVPAPDELRALESELADVRARFRRSGRLALAREARRLEREIRCAATGAVALVHRKEESDVDL